MMKRASIVLVTSRRGLCMIAIGLLLASIPPTPAADKISFKNGNRMEAQVVSIGETSVNLKTNFGEMKIPRREIETIDFDGRMLNVTLVSGETVRGLLAEDAALSVTLNTGAATRKIGRGEIAALEPVKRIQFDALGHETTAGEPALTSPKYSGIQLFAMDKENGLARGWRPSELRLKIDDAEVSIADLAPASPGRVTILVDASLSMKPWLPELQNAIGKFLTDLPAGTPVDAMSFNDDIRPIESPLLQSLEKLQFRGGSLLHDALNAAILQAKGGDAAIILITDGGDSGSTAVGSHVLETLRASSARCFAVALAAPPTALSKNAEGNDLDQQFLEKAASLSGGLFLLKDPRNKKKNPDLPILFLQIARALAATIALHPTTALAPGWHSVDIDAQRGGLKLHFKKQVFLPSAS